MPSGGRREGAGRPALEGNREKKSVTLCQRTIEIAIKLGENNLSKGLNKMAERIIHKIYWIDADHSCGLTFDSERDGDNLDLASKEQYLLYVFEAIAESLEPSEFIELKEGIFHLDKDLNPVK